MTGSTQTLPGYESPGPIRLPPGNLEPVEEDDSEAEDAGSFASESAYDDLLSNIEEEDEDDEEEGRSHGERDAVFEKIKESLSRTQRSDSARSGLSSMSDSSDGPHVQISSQYTSIPYGIQARATYEHSNLHTDIMGVAYNGRMRQFVILDSKGITTWKRDLVDPRVRRALQYPKYEYRLIMSIVYAPKYNCYFALGKDFSVKVLNRDFEETCSVNTDMRSVLYILFNPVRDELITGGVGGIKIWQFQQAAGRAFTELKPLANYELKIKETLPNVGGSWVKRVELDHHLQHLYCCSDTDLHVYDLSGKMLFKFERAHTMSITGCCFSPSAKVLVTSSVDSDVKVWSLTGGLVHTFRGHSRAVTGLLLHPESSSLLITSSLDGSVRMWSLDTMDLLYMIVVSADGVMWMGLTDDKLLYISTCRNITLWHLNNFYTFWSLARNPVTRLALASCEEKTSRILAVGEDSSVRIFTRSNRKNITTVLPPPDISPLQKVLSVCYSREKNTAFLLITNREIWVYTTRTDPACRIAIWDVHDLQLPYISGDTSDLPPGVIIQPPSQTMTTQRATENGHGNEVIANCCSLCILNSTAMMWTDEGLCCPIRHTYLLLGMEDGRILFMDPVIKGQKYMELKASKDAIQDMYHDKDHSCLITLCRLKTLVMIQVWGLPQLDAMYELYCGPDITCFARLGSSILTGHSSGQVNLHILEPMEDLGFQRSTQEPPYESVVDENKRSEHNAGLVAMDALGAMSIYVTCSSDGAIKVWDESKVLLTEIMLEESLSAACFFNEMGDLLVGFKNHIFYIDHTRLCPSFKPPEIEMETSDQESVVYEDPRVLYEILNDDDEPVTLDNYLVPFDLEFDADFLEGKTKIDQPKTAAEVPSESESETETDLSLAPSSIYLSPAESIESLSMIDLTLGADYSKYDLNAQMKSTMDQMVSKAKEEAKWKGIPPSRLYLKLRRIQIANAKKSKYVHRKRKGKKRHKHVTLETPGYSDMEEKELEMEMEKFTLPSFGESPGVSPSITPPSGEVSPKHGKHTEEYEEGYDGETREEAIYKEATGFVPIEPDKASSPLISERGSASTRTMTPETHSHKISPIPSSKHTTKVKSSTPHLDSNVQRKTTLTSHNANEKGRKSDLKTKKMRIASHTRATKTAEEKQVISKNALKGPQEVNKTDVGTDSQSNWHQAVKISRKNQSETLKTSITSPTKAPINLTQSEVKSARADQIKIANQSNTKLSVVKTNKQATEPAKSSIKQIAGQLFPSEARTRPRVKIAEVVETSEIERAELPEHKTYLELEDGIDEPSPLIRTSSVGMKQSSEYATVLQDLKKELEMETKLIQEQKAREELENIKAIFEGFETSHPEDEAKKHVDDKREVESRADAESVVDSAIGSSVLSESPIQRPRSTLFSVTHIIARETSETDIATDKLTEESDTDSSTTQKDSETGFESSEAPPKKKDKSKPEDEEEEDEGSEKKKNVVDMRDIMKKKRRVTSGRAPSLTRKSSADHTHDDHDHGHDDKRTKKEIKKKQPTAMDDRLRPQRMDLSKFPANPPSMLSREPRSSEARGGGEFMQNSTELYHDSIIPDPDTALIQPEDVDMDLLQEAQWATEAAVHGKMLAIPPQKDKHQARLVDQGPKIDPRIQRMKDRKHMLGEREPVDLNTPGLGSSPTAELEQEEEEGKKDQHRKVEQREITGIDKASAAELATIGEQKESDKDKKGTSVGTVTNFNTHTPETQLQRSERLGMKVDANKLLQNEKKENAAVPKSLMRKSKLNVYIPQAERDHSPSAATSYRGTPDSGIEDSLSAPGIQTPRVIVIKEPAEAAKDAGDQDMGPQGDGKDLLTEPDKASALRRPASSYTGLRRGQLEGEKLRAERPHTAHVRFKAELEFIVELPDHLDDLQDAFEDALKRYQTLPGTPATISAETLYKNDGTAFEDNWQQRVIERHTLLRLQKEIRAQSAAQRRQAFEVIKQDKSNTKLFTSRCPSAIGDFNITESNFQPISRANTSMSVPISYGYGFRSSPAPGTREKPRPKTAAPALEKQQIKSELSQEKSFRHRLTKTPPAPSRPSSTKSISTVADFSPHWIDPRNPNAWRPKSSRSIPSKCNRYVLVNKPKERLAAPVPSPLEEQLLVERFPKMGARVVQPLQDQATPRSKKSFSLEYSPFVYQRYS